MTASGASLRVLLYHRIDARGAAQSQINPDITTASPELFERQLRHLTRFYQPVRGEDVLAASVGNGALPARAVLLTFDDGYRDFLDFAWPLLKKYSVPAVVFLPTAFVDDPERLFWSDALWQMVSRTDLGRIEVPGWGEAPLLTLAERLATFRRLIDWVKAVRPGPRAEHLARLVDLFGVRPEPTRSIMSWSEVRQLAADGVTMAAHTRTHERLDQLARDQIDWEVDGCRADLVRELGAFTPLFAYPYGNANDLAVASLKKAGFTIGFTTLCGINNLNRTHPLLLRRDDAHASMARFALRLSEPFARLRTHRHKYPLEMQLPR
jgi:peptidoglycan/xylan/chitin deacetylase (PgdA/CDA1 family)